MAREPMYCLNGLEIPAEEAAALHEWLQDKRGEWFWRTLDRDRENAYLRARIPAGRKYRTADGESRYVPADIHMLESQQNLASELTLQNVLNIRDLVKSWVESTLPQENT
jgi:hypothetical protein